MGVQNVWNVINLVSKNECMEKKWLQPASIKWNDISSLWKYAGCILHTHIQLQCKNDGALLLHLHIWSPVWRSKHEFYLCNFLFSECNIFRISCWYAFDIWHMCESTKYIALHTVSLAHTMSLSSSSSCTSSSIYANLCCTNSISQLFINIKFMKVREQAMER